MGISKNGFYGIFFDASSDGVIRDNVVWGNQEAGIYYGDRSRPAAANRRASICDRSVLTGRPNTPYASAPMTYAVVLVLVAGLLLIRSGALWLQARRVHT